MSNFLPTVISRATNKGEVQVTDQTPLGTSTQTSTRQPTADSRQAIKGASTQTQTQNQTTTVAAATRRGISKEDVGLILTFEISFQNQQPVPPEGEGDTDPCG